MKPDDKPTAAASKAAFRETLWFKKGEVDAVVADAAAQAAAEGQIADLDAADSLPMEDRYLDDGSLTGMDRKRYSVKTGATARETALPAGPVPRRWRKRVSERQLIGEMTSTRPWMLLLTVVLFGVGIAAPVYAFLR